MPFAVALGAEVTAATPEEVRGRLAWAPARCTSGGALHGGAIMALADTLGAICAFLNLPPGAGTSTIESKTNFFSPVRSGHVEAGTRPPPAGRRTLAVQTDARGPAGPRGARVPPTGGSSMPTSRSARRASSEARLPSRA